MAITMTLTCANADELLHDLTALAKLAKLQYTLTHRPDAIVELKPNGPDEPVEPVAVVTEEPQLARAPRRGRPPKSEVVAPQAQAQAQESKSVTPDDCIEAVKTLVARTGDILAPGHVLSTFGVKKTRELTDDNRAAFVAACAAYVAEGSQAAGSQVS